MPFSLSSPHFAPGGDIPQRFTCDGANEAPHLTWEDPPPEVQSFALIMDDPDAPSGTFTHWAVFDIPPDRRELPPGTVVGVNGRNSRGDQGYMGPCPPSGTHRYVFRLFALDVPTLNLRPGASRRAVEDAMAAHVIGQAELIGRYTRSRAR